MGFDLFMWLIYSIDACTTEGVVLAVVIIKSRRIQVVNVGLNFGTFHGYSAIHKAGGFTVQGRSTGLTGIIPVEQKSLHWRC